MENMPKVECAVITCKYNRPEESNDPNYGICHCPKDLILKFRFAGDFGRGNIVFLECINQELIKK